MTQDTASTNRVVVAFGVGWHMAELYQVDRLPGETEPEHADSLPGIGRFTPAQRAHLLTLQVTTGLQQIGQGGLAQDERGKVDAEIAASSLNADTLKDAVLSAHMVLLTLLTATDASVGAAYGLGRALAETMLVPDTQDPRTFAVSFAIHRLRTLQDWLANLEATFPPHAAKAVALTLDDWSRWAQGLGQGENAATWPSDQKRRAGQSLRRQGQMWYGLWTGTIEPTHLLGPDEYARAAQALIRRVGGFAWQFLGGTAIGRVLVILTLALAILLLRISATGHLGGVVGTAVLLLGALGVTTGSAVSAVGRVLRQAQAPLWEAELTQGIATAATILPI